MGQRPKMIEKGGTKVNRVGIMGGTFDPVHLGHLAAAEAARVAFRLDKVVFVPAGRPPHKTLTATPGPLRLAMVQDAVANKPYFEVSGYEVEKPGLSYTIDTIQHFRSMWGTECELYFITGADAILEILTWRAVENLMRLCRFIAVTRPGYALGGLQEEIDNLPAYVREMISVLEVPGMRISSTEIRSAVKNGQEISGMAPQTVCNFITKYRLYKNI